MSKRVKERENECKRERNRNKQRKFTGNKVTDPPAFFSNLPDEPPKLAWPRSLLCTNCRTHIQTHAHSHTVREPSV